MTTKGDPTISQTDDDGQADNVEHKAHTHPLNNYGAYLWEQIKKGTGWLEDIYM